MLHAPSPWWTFIDSVHICLKIPTNKENPHWVHFSQALLNLITKFSCRDHYRDSITEYPNECKDNHDGYDMGHPNQHHQQGESFDTFFVPFISWFGSFLSTLQKPNKLSSLERSHPKCLQPFNPFASSPSTLKIRIEIMRWVVYSMTVVRASRNMSIHAKTYDNFSDLMEPQKVERFAGTVHLRRKCVT